jgi:hypothetical protein
MAQKVFKRKNLQLLFEHISPQRTYSLEVFDGILQYGRPCTDSIIGPTKLIVFKWSGKLSAGMLLAAVCCKFVF